MSHYVIKLYEKKVQHVVNPYIKSKPQTRLENRGEYRIAPTQYPQLERGLQDTRTTEEPKSYQMVVEEAETTRYIHLHDLTEIQYNEIQQKLAPMVLTTPVTTVVNIQRQECDVYIGRGGKWGNPYATKRSRIAQYQVATKEEAIQRYEQYIRNTPELYNALDELEGKRLGCTCKPEPCHGDILIALLEEKKGRNKQHDNHENK